MGQHSISSVLLVTILALKRSGARIHSPTRSHRTCPSPPCPSNITPGPSGRANMDKRSVKSYENLTALYLAPEILKEPIMHAMQSFFLTALATVATAHYVFPSVIEDGVATPPWADVRQYTTYYTNNPVTDVTSVDIRCNVGGSTISSNTTTVNAGDNIGFTVTPNIYRKIPYICYLLNLSLTKSTDPGPAQAYMAKAPSSTNIATWDGSGDVWFKIFGQGPSSFAASGLTWPSMGKIDLYAGR
ncbi:MAG: hypothetical protein M1822_005593 [Bathelium mastoideum]|nr:MAG: hypothetical protein M1822_005593 [Bathelium mastoideum]